MSAAVAQDSPIVLRVQDLVRHIPITDGILIRRAVGQGKAVGAGDTEQLRLALRDYRELTERLLHS